MKSIFAALLLVSSALAFPYIDESTFDKRQSGPYSNPPQGNGANPKTPPPFDAKSQLVSTSGNHAWKAPGPNDSRGPCPGLNAAANHNYLPRNGYATIDQFVTATHDAFGMGQDLATFLAVFGAVADGNVLGWLIGGEKHTGISGSRGNYETDSSPIRADLNQYGSNTRFVMAQFKALLAMQPDAATANYNLEVLRDFRRTRYNDSLHKNPYFYYGPFTGIAVSQAAHTFIYRFMSNKSAAYPEGILDRATLKSFMSVSGPDNALVHTPGHERIPTNFYRRNDAALYGLIPFNQDVSYFSGAVPETLQFGCNMGRVNNFTRIDAKTFTGGVYSTERIAKNPLCFAGVTLQASAASLLGISGPALTLLNTVLTPLVSALGDCPAIKQINYGELELCPGFQFYGGPTGYVPPGAIQDE